MSRARENEICQMTLMKALFGVSMLAFFTKGCVMEPAYLGYEIDLEEAQDTQVQESGDVQETGGEPEQELPQDPGDALTKRECRRLGRKNYSDCRQACEDDDAGCKERCEREARSFMRECLRRAKKGPRPGGGEALPKLGELERSKARLNLKCDENA